VREDPQSGQVAAGKLDVLITWEKPKCL